MKAVVQRVRAARVEVDGESVGEIGRGLLVFLGVGAYDGEEDVAYMVDKIVGLRIFPDEDGKMNLSLLDVGGEMLVVSQFTLYGDCRKGRRPSFTDAAPPDKAERLYSLFVKGAMNAGCKRVETGRFGAIMIVYAENEGPVTMVLDSDWRRRPKE